MFEFIANNLATIIIATILFVGLALVLKKMLKDKKDQKGSCGCACSNCPNALGCHQK